MANTDELYELFRRRFYASADRSKENALTEIGRANAGVRDYMKAATDQATAAVKRQATDAVPSFADNAYTRALAQAQREQNGQTGRDPSAFSYDPTKDPSFNAYEREAERESNERYKTYLAQVSARTNGIASSYAAQVAARAASEAAQGANTRLAQLYNDAYSKYLNEYTDPEYNVPSSGMPSSAGTPSSGIAGSQGGQNGAGAPAVPGQSGSSTLPSSGMQAGDVPGYERPAESEYIPSETVTADPREQHRPSVEPSTYVDPNAGSSAGTYTQENGILYYGDGRGNKLVDENLNPIEVQYDENGEAVPIQKIKNAYNLNGAANEKIVEAGKELGLEAVEIGDERYTNDPSAKELGYFNLAGGTYYCDGKGYPLLNENGVFVSVVRDENGRIIPYTELVVRAQMEEEAAEAEAEAEEEWQEDEEYEHDPTGTVDEMYEYSKRYKGMSAEEILNDPDYQEERAEWDTKIQDIDILMDSLKDSNSTSDKAEYARLEREKRNAEQAIAELDGIVDSARGREAEEAPGNSGAQNKNNPYAGSYASLSEDEKTEIATDIALNYSDYTYSQIIESGEYKDLAEAEKNGTATIRDLFRLKQLRDAALDRISGEERIVNNIDEDDLKDLSEEVVQAIRKEYRDGGVTNYKTWIQLVRWYGTDQLYANGIYMK